MVMAVVAVAGGGDQPHTTWYFADSGTPVAPMSERGPSAEIIPDPDGDGYPGRTLEEGDYQEFLSPGGGLHISGTPEVEIWLAAPGFVDDRGGVVEVGLYECRDTGCQPLAATVIESERWGSAGGWMSYIVRLPEIDLELAPESQVCVRFDPAPGSSVMLAYGSSLAPGALLLPLAVDDATPENPEVGASSTITTTRTSTATSTPPPSAASPDDRMDLLRSEEGEMDTPSTPRSPVPEVPLVTGLVGAAVIAAAALGLGVTRRR